MEKRTKHLTAKLFCLILLSVVLYACQSGLYEFEKVETKSFDVADARNWFEANAHLIRPSEVLSRSTDGSEEAIALNPVFNWNIAEWSNNSEWEVVELPWEYEEVEQIFALWEVWQHAYANNSIPENVTRLIVKQNRNTGETFGFKMRIAPTLNFLLSNGGSLHTNTYLYRDNRLSGIVMFYTLDGRFMNGWRYRNGEITAALTAKTEMDIDNMSVPTTRMSGSNADGWLLDEFVVTGGIILSPSPPLVGVLFWSQFVTVTEEDSGNLPLGGGSANVNPPPPPPPITADRIFRRPANATTQWNNLINSFNEMNNDCMGRALVRELANRLGSNRLNLKFGSGNSYYHPSTGTIEIGALASGTPFVLHELLHALQHMNYSTPAAYAANQMNHEIEAQLAQYMFIRRNAQGSSIGFWNTYYNSRPELYSITQLARYTDRHGNATNATRFNAEVRNAVSLFQASPLYRNLRFNPNMSMNNMFANLRRLSADC